MMRRDAFRVLVFGVALSACAVLASAARADDVVAAQALFDQGKKALADQNFAAACPKFEESYRLDPGLGTLLNLADCLEQQGKLASAWERFLELASKARAAGQTERSAIGKQRAAALVARLPSLVIDASASAATAGLEIKRDGAAVGPAELGAAIPADPGPHAVSASAPGRQPWSATVTLTEGKTVTVAVPALALVAASSPPAAASVATAPPAALTAAAETPPPAPVHRGLGTMRILAIASGAVGVAGIAIGAYEGLHSGAEHRDASQICPGSTCSTQAGSDEWSAAVTAGNVSTAAFVVGGVGIAGAVALWVLAPRFDGAPSAQVGFGPGSIRVSGTW